MDVLVAVFRRLIPPVVRTNINLGRSSNKVDNAYAKKTTHR